MHLHHGVNPPHWAEIFPFFWAHTLLFFLFKKKTANGFRFLRESYHMFLPHGPGRYGGIFQNITRDQLYLNKFLAHRFMGLLPQCVCATPHLFGHACARSFARIIAKTATFKKIFLNNCWYPGNLICTRNKPG